MPVTVLALRRAARIARTIWAATLALAFLDTTAVVAQPAAERRQALIARADSLQLPGSWTPPPGDALAHHTAGFATTLCAAVFITGLDPKDAAANVGFFTGPLEYRGEVKDTVVDRATHTVRLTLKNGVTRVARQYGSQGCVPLPIGEDSVRFKPEIVRPNLPAAARTPWPMGDVIPTTAVAGLDSLAVAHAVDTIFGGPDAMTLAVVVTRKGRIIGERYAPGIGIHTPLESWSMGKSLTGTLVARLIQMGVYKLDQSAPIPEWQQQPDDPRRAIRIMDIMRMSSGLRIRAPQDPDYNPSLGYPDHLYFYTGSADSYHWAATRPQQWKPNTVGRYRNVDPVLASYLVRLGAERLHQDYHAFPQRVLFDKLGMRDAVIYTDPYGNFLGNGAEVVAARDWARLGSLYLQDGVWNGERLLPRGYVSYVRTLAPAWVADGRLMYGGGFFWINGDGREPMPKDAFAMLGAGGQSAWIVPSHDLVIVRIGKYRGEAAGEEARRRGTAMLMQIVPPSP